MQQQIIHLILSAFIYGLYTAFSDSVFIFPKEIVNLSIFLPPLLGIMWGPVTTIGVIFGGCFVSPHFQSIIDGNTAEIFSLLILAFYLALSTYLPYFLWNKVKPDRNFFLTAEALQKLLVVLFVTFFITSVFRTLAASPEELGTVTGLFNTAKNQNIAMYMTVCLLNDFLISVFLVPVIFLALAGKNFNFYSPEMEDVETEDYVTDEEHKALRTAAICYLIFPAAVIYWDIWEIYGMDRLETWMNFIFECFLIMNIYIILVIHLMLRYRRSIMMGIVFFVALTVLLSSAVLGWGSTIAMGNMVRSHAYDSLHAMSVICRERLDRTFFCTRQAVKGMMRQTMDSIGSYRKFIEDVEYRNDCLEIIKKDCDAIAMDTDGCIAYYFRIAPEFAGNKGGFSRQREYTRWEGALSPFVRREPIDLSIYSADDYKNVGWYYIPLKSKTATWIEPYVDPTTKFYVISYVAPLFVDGKFIGVVGMDIDFNFIIQELRRMSIYDYGYVYIMNRNNEVLYHRDQAQGTIFKPNPNFQEIELYLTNGMWLGVATPLSKVHDRRNIVLMHLMSAILFVAFLVTVGSVVLASRAIRPLEGVTKAAKLIADGDLNVKISYDSNNELGILVKSIREMASKLEIYVYRDKLTGVRNPASYISKSADLNEQSKLIPNFKYAVILFDVNFLKKVNDHFGHQAGDTLIKHAAKVISEVFAHSSMIFRIGGDEFVAVLEKEDYENREVLLQLFDEEISKESFTIGEDVINLSVARGMAIYEKGMVFADVAKKADGEMYINKAAIKAKYGEEVR